MANICKNNNILQQEQNVKHVFFVPSLHAQVMKWHRALSAAPVFIRESSHCTASIRGVCVFWIHLVLFETTEIINFTYYTVYQYVFTYVCVQMLPANLSRIYV